MHEIRALDGNSGDTEHPRRSRASISFDLFWLFLFSQFSEVERVVIQEAWFKSADL